MDERLVDLETRLAFQESSIQELNEVVTQQQQQITLLQQELGALKERMRAIAVSHLASADEETPPPHY